MVVLLWLTGFRGSEMSIVKEGKFARNRNTIAQKEATYYPDGETNEEYVAGVQKSSTTSDPLFIVPPGLGEFERHSSD